MEFLLQNMWRWRANSICHVLKWQEQRLSKSRSVECAGLQCAGLPRGLRGECLVWLVVVQCVLRQRDAVSESQHHGCACERRRVLSVFVHEPSVQHAVLRSGLRDGCVVWLVVVQCVLRSWQPDSESECVGSCFLRRCVLRRVV